ncbi:hypothetical protein H4R33_005289 [Dimargaris cristalligena]|nr:hypothetical protein H4R33_005289 [Dimargaris cristalligena]
MADPSKALSAQPSGSSTPCASVTTKATRNVRRVKERIINSHKVIALFEGQVKEYHTLQGKYNQCQSELQALQIKFGQIQAETAQHRLAVTTLRVAHADEVKRREALGRMQGSSRYGSNQKVAKFEQFLANEEMDLALIRSRAAVNYKTEWQQEQRRADQLADQLAQLEAQLTGVRRALKDKQADYQSIVTRGLSKERELAHVQAQLKSQQEASLALQTYQLDLQGLVNSLTTQLQAAHQQRSAAQTEFQGRFDVLTAELQATQQQRQQVQDELTQSQLLWTDQRAQLDEQIRQLSQIQEASATVTLAMLEPTEPLEGSKSVSNEVVQIPTTQSCHCDDELPKIQTQLDQKDQTIHQLNDQIADLQWEVDYLRHPLNEQSLENRRGSVLVVEGPSLSAQSMGVQTEIQRDLDRLQKENAALLDLIKYQQVQIFDFKRSATTSVKTPQSLSAPFNQPPAHPISTLSQTTQVQPSSIANALSTSISDSKSAVQPSRKRRLSVTQSVAPVMTVDIGHSAPPGLLPLLPPSLTTSPIDEVASAPKENINKKAKIVSIATNVGAYAGVEVNKQYVEETAEILMLEGGREYGPHRPLSSQMSINIVSPAPPSDDLIDLEWFDNRQHPTAPESWSPNGGISTTTVPLPLSTPLTAPPVTLTIPIAITESTLVPLVSLSSSLASRQSPEPSPVPSSPSPITWEARSGAENPGVENLANLLQEPTTASLFTHKLACCLKLSGPVLHLGLLAADIRPNQRILGRKLNDRIKDYIYSNLPTGTFVGACLGEINCVQSHTAAALKWTTRLTTSTVTSPHGSNRWTPRPTPPIEPIPYLQEFMKSVYPVEISTSLTAAERHVVVLMWILAWRHQQHQVVDDFLNWTSQETLLTPVDESSLGYICSLTRVFAALCRLINSTERVRVLVYDLFRCTTSPEAVITILSNVVTVWPDPLSYQSEWPASPFAYLPEAPAIPAAAATCSSSIKSQRELLPHLATFHFLEMCQVMASLAFHHLTWEEQHYRRAMLVDSEARNILYARLVLYCGWDGPFRDGPLTVAAVAENARDSLHRLLAMRRDTDEERDLDSSSALGDLGPTHSHLVLALVPQFVISDEYLLQMVSRIDGVPQTV